MSERAIGWHVKPILDGILSYWNGEAWTAHMPFGPAFDPGTLSTVVTEPAT